MKLTDETQYIERIIDGETELFSCFLECYSRPVYSLIVQMVSSPEDAEELVQDTFLKAFRSLNGYKRECRFSTWIYRIAYNTAISAIRRKKQEFIYIEEKTIDNVSDEKADELLCPTDDEERIANLTRAVDLLHPDEKATITLFYYEEKSIEETAEILKLTPTNVKTKLYRIRKKLYVLMNDRYDKYKA